MVNSQVSLISAWSATGLVVTSSWSITILVWYLLRSKTMLVCYLHSLFEPTVGAVISTTVAVDGLQGEADVIATTV